MNLEKQRRKLAMLIERAQQSLTRKESLEILEKYKKQTRKVRKGEFAERIKKED
jgi:hypothetical protein